MQGQGEAVPREKNSFKRYLRERLQSRKRRKFLVSHIGL
jgi:hypothetical protein